ncbi:MAG: thermonuclease family protein [Acidimicrobiales bacterium]|nr:thermonuclease family protein [Acidimicrobiales bacterium]
MPEAAHGRPRPPAASRPGVAALALLLLPLTAACAGRAPSTGDPPGAATVERVVDGDTIVVDLGGRSERVRLIGIDTPESVDPRRSVECFGREAAAFTASLLPAGTPVRLVRDVEARDRYDRLLAYVYRQPDGLFVNAELARQGYALPLTIPPNVAHGDELRALAAEARDVGRGLWAACPDAAAG